MASEVIFPNIDPNGSTFDRVTFTEPVETGTLATYGYGLTIVGGSSLTGQKLVFDGLSGQKHNGMTMTVTLHNTIGETTVKTAGF